MTERQVAAVLTELAKLWHERDTLDHLGGFAPLTVISLRFGLMGGEPQNLKEASEFVGVSPEQAREIENDVLTRLAQAAELAGVE